MGHHRSSCHKWWMCKGFSCLHTCRVDMCFTFICEVRVTKEHNSFIKKHWIACSLVKWNTNKSAKHIQSEHHHTFVLSDNYDAIREWTLRKLHMNMNNVIIKHVAGQCDFVPKTMSFAIKISIAVAAIAVMLAVEAASTIAQQPPAALSAGCYHCELNSMSLLRDSKRWA